jgi:hypothetical protein
MVVVWNISGVLLRVVASFRFGVKESASILHTVESSDYNSAAARIPSQFASARQDRAAGAVMEQHSRRRNCGADAKCSPRAVVRRGRCLVAAVRAHQQGHHHTFSTLRNKTGPSPSSNWLDERCLLFPTAATSAAAH